MTTKESDEENKRQRDTATKCRRCGKQRKRGKSHRCSPVHARRQEAVVGVVAGSGLRARARRILRGLRGATYPNPIPAAIKETALARLARRRRLIHSGMGTGTGTGSKQEARSSRTVEKNLAGCFFFNILVKEKLTLALPRSIFDHV